MKMVKEILLLVMAIRLTVSSTQNGDTNPTAVESLAARSHIQYEEITRASTSENSNVKKEINYNSEIRKPTVGRGFVKFESQDADYAKKRSFAKNLHSDPNQEKTEYQDADQFFNRDLFTLKDEDFVKIPSVDFHSESREKRRNIDLTTVLEVEKYLKSHPELPALSREDIIFYIQNISEANGSDFKTNWNESADEIFHNTKPEISKKNTNSKANDESIMLIFPEKFDKESDIENLKTEKPWIKTDNEKDLWNAGAWEENISEDEAVKSYEKSQSTSKKNVYDYPVYKAIKTEKPSITTDTTARSYANYDDPEMVTKSHNFEAIKGYKSLQQPFNHKYDEEIAPVYGSEKLGEGLDGAIIVLPVKDSNYDKIAKSTETDISDDLKDKEEHDMIRDQETTSSPIYVTPAKIFESFPEKQIKTNPEKPLSKLSTLNIPESLENFGLDHVKIDDSTDVPTVKKSSADETQSKRKKFIKRKRTKNKAATAKDTDSHNDLLKIVEILPEDMKGLLENLNLGNGTMQESVSLRPDTERQSQPSIDPSSFSRFKPLPLVRSWEDGKKKSFDGEMKEFLASFGLVAEDNTNWRRQQKSYMEKAEMKYLDAVPQVNLEIIPEDMRHVIYNLGLANRQRKQSADHVFNPNNHSVNQSQEEMEKLKALMAIVKKIASFNDSEPVSAEMQTQISQQIKELDNLSVKYKNKQSSQMNDEIKQIIITNKEKFDFIPLQNFTEYQREKEKLGLDLDPLYLAETPRVKNEVKRQTSANGNNSSESSSGSLSETTDMEMGFNSSEELSQTTKGISNVEGLKESFGGGETASDDADVDSALPPKKPNGLYLLVDWNSFLEVGTEDDKRRVNIRFQPKIGDGRHFIPVTIP